VLVVNTASGNQLAETPALLCPPAGGGRVQHSAPRLQVLKSRLRASAMRACLLCTVTYGTLARMCVG